MRLAGVVGTLIVGLVLGGIIGFVARPMVKTGAQSITNSAATGGAHASCSISGAAESQDASLLEIEGKQFKLGDLPTGLQSEIHESREQSYEQEAGLLKQYAIQYLLAKEKMGDKVDPENLPPLDQLLGSTKVSDAEVKKVFEENKARMPKGVKLEQVKGDIERFVQNQKMAQSFGDKLRAAEDSHKFQVMLPKPVAPVVNLSLEGYPSIGEKTAKHTLVEVSDYLCPHCQQIQPQVKELAEKLGPDLKFVQVDYALQPSGLSGALAKGGFCAAKQGDDKFWTYHDAAFAMAEKGELDRKAKDLLPEVMKVVEKVGLKKDDFKKCMDSEEAKQSVGKTLSAMSDAGVRGTPTFFLDNRRLEIKGGDLKGAVEEALDNTKS